LFSENLTDALSLGLEIATETPKTPVASSFSGLAPQSPSQPAKPKPKPSTTSSFVSFLTPKKNKLTPSKAAPLSEPSTPSRGLNKTIAASPFGAHYQQTRDITVEPFAASMESSGPWTPAKFSKWALDDDDPFNNHWGEIGSPKQRGEDKGGSGQPGKKANVTLSHLLDNVVILEESIKELVAIIHARRSFGIDSVRYL